MTNKTEILAGEVLELLAFMGNQPNGAVEPKEISRRGLSKCREGLRGAQYKRHGLLLDCYDTYFNFGAQELYEDLISFIQKRVKFDYRSRDYQIVYTPNWSKEERGRCLEAWREMKRGKRR